MAWPGRGNRELRASPHLSDDSETQDHQDHASNWGDWDWQDYNYNSAPPDLDTLACLFNELPGLDASAIETMLSNLPIPTTGVVPAMTVEEAVEVNNMSVNICYAL